MELLENQLTVKISTLPNAGKGLFTKKAIIKGDKIVEYTGKITTWKEVEHTEGTNPYIFYVNKNHVIDASKDESSIAKYANDARGLTRITGLVNNTEFVEEGTRVFLIATKDIPKGGEIFVGYGKEYWDTVKFNMKIDKDAAAKKAAGTKKKKKKAKK
ncbi:hypothetical protein SAMN05421788_103339 [Filimonas lacunae]|uniref:SET domain-containing protein n=1 Tax=Filimonas lacunae TaxID=477680 RepID=A0A1N7PB72_9BACT|nr:SET domain-containing protein [Filimonas lacunae]SIT07679.1 hypothetical protein SAMN05421788_103339 [Filimonas lacunae]